MEEDIKRAIAKMSGFSGEGNLYTFHRKGPDGQEFFYPIELKDDEDARKNAEWNPGTIRVEDLDGNVVWRSDN